MLYTCDFETTTDPNDCRIWSWGLCDINDPDNFDIGIDIGTLFQRFKKKSVKLYFHNLKFDGEFILYWLYRNGYEYKANKEDLISKSFTTLISDKNQWYSIVICERKRFRNSVYINIYDSLKILPFSVEKIAKAFKLDISKGSIDYDKYRPVGYTPTEKEFDYIKKDCQIVAIGLKTLFDQKLTSMTAGSNALKDFKRLLGVSRFADLFPAPWYDADVRESYRGGFTYLSKRFQQQEIGSGIVLDFNSLYPAVMRNELLPFGEGLHFEGEYVPDKIYTVYVQMLTCQFRLRPDHIPTIQIKGDNLMFNPVDYIEYSDGHDVTMCMTNVDLQLFFEHYDVYNIDYHSGWKFKAATGIFNEYIDFWSEVKINAKLDDNAGMYTLAKLMLNSLYGKFALNPSVAGKLVEYDKENDMIHYKKSKPTIRIPIYIPVGAFITSYARNKTIRAAQSVYDRFIYADTDSLHLTGTDVPTNLDVDPIKLGALKHEFTFSKAYYVRPKCYLEYGYDPEKSSQKEKLKVTAAGFPESCHEQITFENFRVGATYKNILRPMHVPGGIVLEQYEKTLRDKGYYF